MAFMCRFPSCPIRPVIPISLVLCHLHITFTLCPDDVQIAKKPKTLQPHACALVPTGPIPNDAVIIACTETFYSPIHPPPPGVCVTHCVAMITLFPSELPKR